MARAKQEKGEPTRLTIKSFPKFKELSKNNPLKQISNYLHDQINKGMKKATGNKIQLPSVFKLCAHFKCSQADVVNVLLKLRGKGLDYSIEALDEPIALWKAKQQSKKGQARNQKRNGKSGKGGNGKSSRKAS